MRSLQKHVSTGSKHERNLWRDQHLFLRKFSSTCCCCTVIQLVLHGKLWLISNIIWGQFHTFLQVWALSLQQLFLFTLVKTTGSCFTNKEKQNKTSLPPPPPHNYQHQIISSEDHKPFCPFLSAGCFWTARVLQTQHHPSWWLNASILHLDQSIN